MIIKLKDVNANLIENAFKKIFIYPTDTIYGIGCNAKNKKLVEKIREIKNRDSKPFSIIAPNFSYIIQNCEVDLSTLKKYLPGPYTLILKKRNKNFLNHVSNSEYIGIRIPKHPIKKFLQKTGKPVITTSVNISGEKPANRIEEINKEILEKVEIIIDGGKLSGKSSKIIKDGKLIKR